MAKTEVSDIMHHLYPSLKKVDIDLANIKQDVATKKTKKLRGDLWISSVDIENPKWEKNIVCLIEAKPVQTKMDDNDWKDAMEQGQKKATLQGLSYFVVTNTAGLTRFYNTKSLNLISINGNLVTSIPKIDVLKSILTQVDAENSNVEIDNDNVTFDYNETDFQKSLFQLKNTYRSSKMDNDAEMIATTIGFIVLKYICEKEKKQRNIDSRTLLWDELREDHYEEDIKSLIDDIMRCGLYKDFQDALYINPKLSSKQCEKIVTELGKYSFHGCGFDIYGAVYEAYADKNTKKAFGEYYTRRHITRAIAEILLRDEKKPRDFTICDPACGTGGFLTEAYKVLERNYVTSKSYTKDDERRLQNDVIIGFDNKKSNICLAKLNMFLIGDGHVLIADTSDSLLTLKNDSYDYVLANPPYGVYKGDADVELFKFAQKSRMEMLFLEKIVDSLKPGGMGAVVIPDGVLENTSYSDYRLNLLHYVEIESIISLHEYVFRPYTSEKTYVVIFRKKSEKDYAIQKDPIWMYIVENDGYQKGDKRYEILENDLPDLIENYKSNRANGRCRFVEMSEINEDNFYNLLVEYYLPNDDVKVNLVSAQKFDKILNDQIRFVEKLKIVIDED